MDVIEFALLDYKADFPFRFVTSLHHVSILQLEHLFLFVDIDEVSHLTLAYYVSDEVLLILRHD